MARSGEKLPPGLLLLILALSLAAAISVRILSCSSPSYSQLPVSEHRRTVPALGTFATIVLVADEELAADVFVRTDSILAAIQTQLGFSGGGSLTGLNLSRCGSMDVTAGHWTLHPALVYLIHLSDTLNTITGGSFDPSVGALVDLWGWPANPALPDSATIDSMLAHTGWENITFTPDSIFLPDGMMLDFGAVAKGYAVDMVYLTAMEMGVSGVLVEIGGEVRCGSTEGLDRTWRVAVRHPRSDGFWDTLEMDSGAVATSGDYESFFISDGVRYSHLLNPRTGWPSGETVSATVTSDRCDVADAIATAVAVGGQEVATLIPDSLYGVIIILTEDVTGEVTEWRTGGAR